jgi:cytochrome oxidase Cu insertion factor (SCO1/SenC/PrrC family)
MLRVVLIAIVVTALSGAGSAFAQPARGSGQGGNRLPAVGMQLPDVQAYDEFGNSFSTSSLRGTYSVLVFGCLT